MSDPRAREVTSFAGERPLRSVLFVPGNRGRMLEKVAALEVDAAVFDLEDAVPVEEKAAARTLVTEALARPAGGTLLFVRVAAPGAGALAADLTVVGPGLAGLVVPKVEAPEDIEAVDRLVDEREHDTGLTPGSVRLVALIESSRGLIAAPEVAASSRRLVALMFGAEDFARDLGMPALTARRTGDMLYARSAIVVAAASQRLEAIDRAWLDLGDAAGLLRDARQGRELGFTGKALIHPGQIDAVRDVFRPSEDELRRARRIVAAFDAAAVAGRGAVVVDGQMVDRPIAARARRLLSSELAPPAEEPRRSSPGQA